MIQVSSRKIVKHASNLEVINKEIEVYQYGMEIIISSIIDFALLLIMGVIFNGLLESIVYYFSFAYIRKYSGGLHMNTYTSCILIHNIIFLGLILTKHINYVNMFMYVVLIALAGLFYKLAPVKNKNKPLLEHEIKRYRNKACLIYAIYLMLALIIQGKIGSTIIYVLLIVNLLMIICIHNNE